MRTLRDALRRAVLLAAALLAAPTAATAHPHIFIDADAALIFDPAGRLEAIRVTWSYDEFYSLTMIEDAGLDADGDGTPEAERLRAYAGQDVDWAAGFPGHIVVEQDGRPVQLQAPVAHAARYRDGRIITSHVRPLPSPAAVTAARPVQLRLYDSEYFVAYDTPRAPTIEGRSGCGVTRRQPDATGQKELLAALQELDAQADSLTFLNMADVGITFADRFEVACGAP